MRLPLRSWKNTLGSLGLRLVERKPKRRRQRQARLTIESLEQRQLLSATTVDDSDEEFSTVGQWDSSVAGHDGGSLVAQAGFGEEKVEWSFTGLTPGLYSAATTWAPVTPNTTSSVISVQAELTQGWPTDGTSSAYTIAQNSDAAIVREVRPNRENAETFVVDSPLALDKIWVQYASRFNGTGFRVVLYRIDDPLASTLETPEEDDPSIVLDDTVSFSEISGALSGVTNDADYKYMAIDVEDVQLAPGAYALQFFSTGAGRTFKWVQQYGSDVGGDRYESGGRQADDRNYRFALETTPAPALSSYAPFRVYNGDVAFGTVNINQSAGPNDFTAEGSAWEDLGGPYVITSTTAHVELRSAVDGGVVADAVRLERIGDLPLSINLGASTLAGGGGTVSATVSRPGGTSGNLVVTLASSDTNEATVPSTVTILDGQSSASFTIAGASSSAFDGARTVTITATATSFGAGQASLTVTDEGQHQTIDDGDAGFSTIGTWIYDDDPTPAGFDDDIHIAGAGTGANQARWSFTGLPVGTYRILATWTADTTRASSATYTAFDGSTSVASYLVNQKNAPADDVTESGTDFQQLGIVTVVNQNLVVRLANNANGEVVADAVRIELASLTEPEPNRPPVIFPIGDQSLVGTSEVEIPLSVTDNEDDEVTVSVTASSLGYQLQQQYGLFLSTEGEKLDWGGADEKWLEGSGSQWYFILPNGDFYHWDGTNLSATGDKLQSLGPHYYDNLDLLYDSVTTVPATVSIETIDDVPTLVIDPDSGFEGVFEVTLTAEDADGSTSQTVRVSVSTTTPNKAPVMAPIQDRYVNGTGVLHIPLTVSDPNGDTVTYTATGISIAYELDQSLGLFLQSGTDQFNTYSQQERWLRGNSSIWYVLLPNGELYQWGGVAKVIGTNLIETPGSYYHHNLSQLYSASSTAPATVSVQTIEGVPTLVVDPNEGFRGTFKVSVTADDGTDDTSQTIRINVGPGQANQAGLLAPIGEQTVPGSGRVNIPLSVNASAAGPVSVTVSAVSVAYELDQQYDLYLNASDDQYNVYGRQERWLHGPGSGEWYFILPNGELYHWDGTAGFATGTLVGTPGRYYHENLSQLYSATQSLPIKAEVRTVNGAPVLSVDTQGFDGDFKLIVVADDGAVASSEVVYFDASVQSRDADQVVVTRRDEALLNSQGQSVAALNPVPTVLQVRDNPEGAFAGTWSTYTGGGHYGANIRFSASGAGAHTAAYQFSNLYAGTYKVYATWDAYSNQATNAPYTVNGGGTPSTVTVNQKVQPAADAVDGGRNFQLLGTYTVTGSSLSVVLTNNANGNVAADAVRIESAVLDWPQYGIAVTGADQTGGAWQYSLNDGATWMNLAAVSAASSLLLPAAGGRVRYQPSGPHLGAVQNALSFRGWTGSGGNPGDRVETYNFGPSTPFGSETIAVPLNITPAVGAEQRANGSLQVDSLYGNTTPAPARNTSVASDGRYLATWTGLGADGFGLYGQWFTPPGAKFSDELLISDVAPIGSIGASAVAITPTGAVVVYSELQSNGTDSIVRGRLVDADGTTGGSIFDIGSTQTYEGLPAVATDSSGRFLVTWRGESSGAKVLGRFYNASATALDSAFAIGGSGSVNPSVAMRSSGEAIVVWDNGTSVYAQRYNSSGTAVGSNITVASGYQASVAVDGSGNFIVAYSQYGAGISARRYNSSGTLLGTTLTVSVGGEAHETPSVATDAAGKFVVTWLSRDSQHEAQGIQARWYGADAVAMGPPHYVNTDHAALGIWSNPQAAGNAGGDFVISWSSRGADGARDGLYTQRFVLHEAPTAATLASFSIKDPLAVDLAHYFRDRDDRFGDVLTYSIVSNTQPTKITPSLSGSTLTLSRASSGSSGASTITVAATDTAGLSTTLVLTVTASSSTPPTVASPLADVTVSEDAADSTISLSGVFSGGTLTYSVANVAHFTGTTTSSPSSTAPLLTASIVSGSLVLDYQPDMHGTAFVTVRATDSTGLVVQDTLAVNITPVNDAPTLLDRDLAWSLARGTSVADNHGYLVADLVGGLRDVDANATTTGSSPPWSLPPGIALIHADTSYGSWQTSFNGGATWLNVGDVSETDALLLSANAYTRLRFRPNVGMVGTIAEALTFVAWDASSGTSGSTVDASVTGGATPFSAQTDTVALTINPALGDAFQLAEVDESWSLRTEVAADGSYLVAWSDSEDAHIQRFSASGALLGQSAQSFPADTSAFSIGLSANGASVLVMYGWGGPVVAQRLDASAQAVGSPITVAGDDAGGAAVAVGRDGSFAVAWNDAVSGDIRARFYSAAGVAQGSEFSINVGGAQPSLTSWSPVGTFTSRPLALDASNNLVAVWTDIDASDDMRVLARRFDDSGTPLTGVIPVGSADETWLDGPAVAASGDGRFAVTWTEFGGGPDVMVHARALDAAGDPASDDLVVNTGNFGWQPSVAMDDRGQFAVSWLGQPNGRQLGVAAQWYDAAGDPLGEPMLVNTVSSRAQSLGAQQVAANPGGRYLAAWLVSDVLTDTMRIEARWFQSSQAPTASSGIADVEVDEDAAPTEIDLEAAFADADLLFRDTLTFTVTANSNEALVTATVDGGTLKLTYAANQSGSATLTIRATDQSGAYVEDPFNVIVNAVNDAPTATGVSNSLLAVSGDPQTFDLKTWVEDAEDAYSNLTFAIQNNSAPSTVTASIANGQLTLTPGSTPGTATVTLRVTDSGSLYREIPITVTVIEPCGNLSLQAAAYQLTLPWTTTAANSSAWTVGSAFEGLIRTHEFINDSEPSTSNYDSVKTIYQTGSSNSTLTASNSGNGIQNVFEISNVTSWKTIAVSNFNQVSIYNPATQGALSSVSASLDAALHGWGSSMGVQQLGVHFAIRQDGKTYFTPLGPVTRDEGFTSFSVSNLVAAAFTQYDENGGVPDTKPDFAGSQMEFGFAFSMGVQVGVTATASGDNFKVTTNSESSLLSTTLLTEQLINDATPAAADYQEVVISDGSTSAISDSNVSGRLSLDAMMGGVSGTYRMYGAALRTGQTFEPTTRGSLLSLDMSVDFKPDSITPNDPTSASLIMVIKQDGKHYYHSPSSWWNIATGSSVQTFTATGLTAASFSPLDGGSGLDFSVNGGEMSFGFGFGHSTTNDVMATDIQFANFSVTTRTVRPANTGVAVTQINPNVTLYYLLPYLIGWQMAHSASIESAVVLPAGTQIQIIPNSSSQSSIPTAFTYTPVYVGTSTPTGPVNLTQNTCSTKVTGSYQPVGVVYVVDASDPYNADSDSVGFKPHQIYTRPISVETKTGNVIFRGDRGPDTLADSIQPVYRQTGDLNPIVTVDYIVPPNVDSLSTFEAKLTFAGIANAKAVAYSFAELKAGQVVKLALQANHADIAKLKTGHYNYQVEITEKQNGADPVHRTLTGTYDLVNRRQSEFGVGWWLDSLDRLITGESDYYQKPESSGFYEGGGNGVLLARGDGTAGWFEEEKTAEGAEEFTTETTYRSPQGSFTKLVRIDQYEGNEVVGVEYELRHPGGTIDLFDEAGLLESRTDRNGNKIVYEYDEDDDNENGLDNELLKISDVYGLDTTYDYADGYLETVTDFAGRETDYENEDGYLTTITGVDPDYVDESTDGPQESLVLTLDYYTDSENDAGTTRFGLLHVISSGLMGQTTTIEYDAAGRFKQAESADGTHWQLVAQDVSLLPSIKRADGTTTSSGDPQGTFEEIVFVPTYVLQAAYTNERGAATGGNETDYEWKYTLDRFGYMTSQTDPKSNSSEGGDEQWSFTRNSDGLMVSKTEPAKAGGMNEFSDGLTTHYKYNAYGKLTEVTYPQEKLGGGGNITETWQYDPKYNQLDLHVDAEGYITDYFLDVDTEAPDPSHGRGNVLELRQQVDGDVDTYVDDPEKWVTTKFTYTSPWEAVPGETDRNLPGGLVTLVTDPRGIKTRTEYYDFGEDGVDKKHHGLVKQIKAGIGTNDEEDEVEEGTINGILINASTTEYRYDDARNANIVIQQMGSWDPAENTPDGTDDTDRWTRYKYDRLDRLVELKLPTSKHVDASGDIESIAPTTEYKYDSDNFLIKETDPLGRVTEYVPDSMGRLDRTILPESQFYNPSSPGSPVTAKPEIVNTYDLAGNLETVTDANGNTTTYVYNSRNEQIEIHRPATADHDESITELVYDSVGNVKFLRQFLSGLSGNRMQETGYSYDRLHRQTRIVQPDPNRNIVTSLGSSTGSAHGSPVTDFTYDNVGHLKSQTNPHEEGDSSPPKTDYTYDGLGRLIKTEAPSVAYVPNDYVLGSSTSLPTARPTTEFEYDANSNLNFIFDAEGNGTSFYYDSMNRQETIVQSATAQHDPPITEMRYNDAGEMVSRQDPPVNGGSAVRETKFVYDTLGRQSLIIQPEVSSPDFENPVAPTTAFLYDRVGNLRFTIDADQMAVHAGSTPLDKALDAIADDMATEHVFDALDRRTTTIAPLVAVTDSNGNETSGRPTTEVGYDKNGNTLMQQDANGNKTVYGYDQQNRLIRITAPDPDGGGGQPPPITELHYDAVGNQTRTIQHVQVDGAMQYRLTEVFYDNLNRPYRQTTHVGASATTFGSALTKAETTYYITGLTKQSKTFKVANGTTAEATSFQYDNLGRKTSQSVPTKPGQFDTTQFAFDLAGNTRRVIDPAGNETLLAYDELYRQIGESTRIDTSGGPATVGRGFEYDEVGNLVNKTDRNGREIEFEYDKLGRRTKETWLGTAGGGYEANYEYDLVGQLIGASDGNTAHETLTDIVFGLDAMGQAISVQEKLAGIAPSNGAGGSLYDSTLNYGFDASGNRTRTSASINGTADFVNLYGYDPLNRMVSIEQTGPSGSGVNAKTVLYTYQGDSQLDTISRYNSTMAAVIANTAVDVGMSNYNYFANGQLKELEHNNSVGSTQVRYAWTYDDNNRIRNFDITRGIVDPTGLLATHNVYTYDDSGQTTGDGLTTTDYVANGNRADNEHSTTKDNRLASDVFYNYQYDAEGNRTLRTIKPYSKIIDTDFVPTADNISVKLHGFLNNDTTQGFAGSQYVGLTSSGNGATWTITNLPPGTYDVYATWKPTTLGATGEFVTGTSRTPVASRIHEYASFEMGSQDDLEAGLGTAWQEIAGNVTVGDDNTVIVTLDGGNVGIDAIQIIRRTADVSATRYAYDYENRLVSVTNYSDTSATTVLNKADYFYDALGRRVAAKFDDGSASYYAFDGQQVVHQFDTAGNLEQRVLWGVKGHLIAFEDKSPTSTYATAWALTDQAGSVRDLMGRRASDTFSHVIQTQLYNSFGNAMGNAHTWPIAAGTSTFSLNLHYYFAGQQWDRLAGLQLSSGAAFDPVTGQFMQQNRRTGDTNPYRRGGNAPNYQVSQAPRLGGGRVELNPVVDWLANRSDNEVYWAWVGGSVVIAATVMASAPFVLTFEAFALATEGALIGGGMYAWAQNTAYFDDWRNGAPTNPDNLWYTFDKGINSDYERGMATYMGVGAAAAVALPALAAQAPLYVSAPIIGGLGAYGVSTEAYAAAEAIHDGNYFQAGFHAFNAGTIIYGGVQGVRGTVRSTASANALGPAARSPVWSSSKGDVIVDSANLPGAAGVQIGRRLTPSEMEGLTLSHGVEFSLVYRTGAGRNGGGGTFWLHSGALDTVDVPYATNVRWISHTHPAGRPLRASGYAHDGFLGDQDVLLWLQQNYNSPQKSSLIIPVGDTPFRFNTTNPRMP